MSGRILELPQRMAGVIALLANVEQRPVYEVASELSLNIVGELPPLRRTGQRK